MRKIILQHEIAVLLLCFMGSRLLVAVSGVHFQYEALSTYWQYLDVESLQHNALKSVWYMHGQPPLFNLLAAAVLKCSGGYAPAVFQALWILISFCNACLLLRILKSRVATTWLPLAVALYYVLSPATILFENELFYTSLTSLLLLLALFFLNRYVQQGSNSQLVLFFTSLTLLCLTRATFHLVWLAAAGLVLSNYYYKKKPFKRVLACLTVSLLLTGSWYVKNALLFGQFSVSSWTGINLSRIVFHDVAVSDSATIAAIHPFLPISYYKRYITPEWEKYQGKNDRVLLREMKNDSAINMNHAGYIQVSSKYMQASLNYIPKHPGAYLKNMATSFIIFFTPASSYFQVEKNCAKLSLYDAVYSGNPAHFFTGREAQKTALAIAALPKLLVYLLVFGLLAGKIKVQKKISVVEAFIAGTILFILIASTIFEYGENMRFRYEVEPLFLILTGRILDKRFSVPKKQG